MHTVYTLEPAKHARKRPVEAGNVERDSVQDEKQAVPGKATAAESEEAELGGIGELVDCINRDDEAER